jgi:protein gp37
VGKTSIEWTSWKAPDGTVYPGYTFNGWLGCEKISPACVNCYAESWAKRTGKPELWQGSRRRTTQANWREPIKWHASIPDGQRRRVFCASLADVFDNQVPNEWRSDLWELIAATPKLDWLLLTKRIGNVMSMVPWYSYRGSITPRYHFPANVWIGATCANQEEADRDIGKLLRIPARVHFVSFEPLLGPIRPNRAHVYCPVHDFEGGFCSGWCPEALRISWAIVGGESGPRARSMVLGWAKDIVRDCHAAQIPVFCKQLGAKPTNREGEPHPVSDHKGAIMAEWPELLRVRQFPEVA